MRILSISFRLCIPLLAAAACVTLTACDTKVSQCNKLIDVVNNHTQNLKGAIEQLANFDKDAKVAESFESTVENAQKDIGALEFSDEKVAGFAKSYQDLLGEAKGLGTMLQESAGDGKKRAAAVEKAEKIVKMENAIVDDVNGYCAN